MTLKHDPSDITIWNYEYIKYAMAIYPIVQEIKNLIDDSKDKVVIVFAKDLIKEIGHDFEDKSFANIYTNFKYIMYIYGIVVNSGFHLSGNRVLIMRHVTVKDKLTQSWKKRSKFIKRLMKTDKWKEMTKSRTEKSDIIGDKINVLA